MNQSNGIHCGVRRQSVIMFDENENTPTGIYVAEQPVGETVEEQARAWKYAAPDVSERDLCLLNHTETNFLERYLPVYSGLWVTVAAHNLSLAEHDFSDIIEE